MRNSAVKSKQIAALILVFALSLPVFCQAGTWVDTLDTYAREKYLPPSRYMWTWVDAALLNTMVKQYDLTTDPAKKQIYLAYVQKAMKVSSPVANGRMPNDVASALGFAFLYRVTREEKYKLKAEKIYRQYLKIKRTKEGAVSHLPVNIELWDDTVFMVGQFLLAMYQATGEQQYLDEFMKQLCLHRDKLQDTQTGLWVHGWDSDHKDHCFVCGQTHWPDKTTRRSAEIWGRGNGWIVVTLADALNIVGHQNPVYPELSGYLKEMIQNLPALQDSKTGHWYQLPVRNTDSANFIESSCTAMFAYGIEAALKLDIVKGEEYKRSVALAYNGLRTHSLVPVAGQYLITRNVCTATCIGDKNYYLHRKVQKGKPYGIGMFIQFGLNYELDHHLR